jgi:hypothetical protein
MRIETNPTMNQQLAHYNIFLTDGCGKNDSLHEPKLTIEFVSILKYCKLEYEVEDARSIVDSSCRGSNPSDFLIIIKTIAKHLR